MTQAVSRTNGPPVLESGLLPRLLGATRTVARLGLWLGGCVITLAALLICIDILMRVFLGHAIDGTDELARFALAISTTWALAGALLDRAHIRVDTAYARFPGVVRLALDLAGLLAFFFVFGLIFLYGVEIVAQSWVSESRSTSALQILMVIPQTLWLAGIALLLVANAVLFAAALRLIATGHFHAASTMIGMKSAEEEVQEELHSSSSDVINNGQGT